MLPGLVAVMMLFLWGLAAMAIKIACVDAVRAGVRAAARGEPLPEVRAAVARAVPAGAKVSVRRDADTTSIRVVATVRLPGGGPTLPTISTTAVGLTEPGVVPGQEPVGGKGGHAVPR
jgi:hypothetical protein